MKTKTPPFITVLIGLMLIFSFNKSNAQPSQYRLPQPGLQQTEVYIMNWTTNWQPNNLFHTHLYDTVVGPYTYAVVASSTLLGPCLFYYDTGKVYVRMSSLQPINNPYQWFLLYDFSLPLGGTFVPTYPGSFLISGDTFTVDSVSTILLPNGQTRKYMELQGSQYRLSWIDGIGDIEHGLIYYADFEGGHIEYVCSSDTSGLIYEQPLHTYICSNTNALPGNGPNNCGIFNYNTTVTPRTCTCNGSIQVTNLTGGTAPYSFSWNNNSGNSSVTGLCSGNILLTITDSAGISCSQSYNIGNNPLVVTISNTADPCSYTDTLCTNISGGTPPYTYAWVPLSSSDSCLIVNVTSPYFCYITDANGCTITGVNTTNLTTTPLYYVPTIQQASCATCCDGSIDIDFLAELPLTQSPTPMAPGPSLVIFAPVLTITA